MHCCKQKNCIQIPEVIGDNIQICKEYKEKGKYSHLCRLAEPKQINIVSVEQPVIRNVKKRIHIIDITDHVFDTRTEQLAFPKTRHLIELKKNNFFQQFDVIRKLRVNYLYRRSLLSVYSRLANRQPEKEIIPPEKWDRETKLRMRNTLRKLSRPKRDFSKSMKIKKPKLKKYQITPPKTINLKRLTKLSKPKKYVKCDINEWCLTESLKRYKPTARILKLSKPKGYTMSVVKDEVEAYKVEPLALGYKATARIKQLATPRRFNTDNLANIVTNPFQTKPTALKAKCSKRTEELAEPKEYEQKHIRDDPYAVSANAMKAKPSPRILLLAQPKKVDKPEKGK